MNTLLVVAIIEWVGLDHVQHAADNLRSEQGGNQFNSLVNLRNSHEERLQQLHSSKSGVTNLWHH